MVEILQKMQLKWSHEKSATGNEIHQTGQMAEELLPKRSRSPFRRYQLLDEGLQGQDTMVLRVRKKMSNVQTCAQITTKPLRDKKKLFCCNEEA